MTGHDETSVGEDAHDDLNRTVRYAAWAVYGRSGVLVDGSGMAARELDSWARALADEDIVLRGWYDVSGLRAGTDLMLWLH